MCGVPGMKNSGFKAAISRRRLVTLEGSPPAVSVSVRRRQIWRVFCNTTLTRCSGTIDAGVSSISSEPFPLCPALE